MIKDFIETFKELKDEYIPNLTPKKVFVGVILFFLILSTLISVIAYNVASRQSENISTAIEYIKLGEKTTIKRKETLFIDDKELSSIRLENVIDSRCPENVQCIVAGELTYNMLYRNREKEEKFIISTVRHKSTIINGYKVTISSGEKSYVEIIVEKVPEPEDEDGE